MGPENFRCKPAEAEDFFDAVGGRWVVFFFMSGWVIVGMVNLHGADVKSRRLMHAPAAFLRIQGIWAHCPRPAH
jgi:hypothetical protein